MLLHEIQIKVKLFNNESQGSMGGEPWKWYRGMNE